MVTLATFYGLLLVYSTFTCNSFLHVTADDEFTELQLKESHHNSTIDNRPNSGHGDYEYNTNTRTLSEHLSMEYELRPSKSSLESAAAQLHSNSEHNLPDPRITSTEAPIVLRTSGHQGVKVDTKESQQRQLKNEEIKCLNKAKLEVNSSQSSTHDGPPLTTAYCESVWDGALCWNRTLGGTLAEQMCPNYVYGFNRSGTATRFCTPKGIWETNPETGDPWTNYTNCKMRPKLRIGMGRIEMPTHFIPYLDSIKMIAKTGYSVSLASLVIAFAILRFNKKLRCPRNTLHLHLFSSFMIRSGVFLLKLLFAMVPSDPPEAFVEPNHSVLTSNWTNDSSVSDQSNLLVNSTSQPLTSHIIKRSLVNALPVASLSLLHSTASPSTSPSSSSSSFISGGLAVNNLNLALNQSASSALSSLASSTFNSGGLFNWPSQIQMINSTFFARLASSLIDHQMSNDSSSVISLANSTSVDESTFNSTSNVTSTSLYTSYDSLNNWVEGELFASTNRISCRILTVIWQYSLVANYNWIFIEGIYLHNLVFMYIFNDNTRITKYVIAGWGVPVLIIVPWSIAKSLYDDNLCWTTNLNTSTFWIIRGPVTFSIILNSLFFANITRVLFTKMFSSSATSTASDHHHGHGHHGHHQHHNSVPGNTRVYNYSKWFKSTLVLVPLFGVHYFFLLFFQTYSELSHQTVIEVAWLYVDTTFTTFQGFFVALLYCFLNGEVQQELVKLWRKFVVSDQENQYNAHSMTFHSIVGHTAVPVVTKMAGESNGSKCKSIRTRSHPSNGHPSPMSPTAASSLDGHNNNGINTPCTTISSSRSGNLAMARSTSSRSSLTKL